MPGSLLVTGLHSTGTHAPESRSLSLGKRKRPPDADSIPGFRALLVLSNSGRRNILHTDSIGIIFTYSVLGTSKLCSQEITHNSCPPCNFYIPGQQSL